MGRGDRMESSLVLLGPVMEGVIARVFLVSGWPRPVLPPPPPLASPCQRGKERRGTCQGRREGEGGGGREEVVLANSRRSSKLCAVEIKERGRQGESSKLMLE